MPTHRFDELTTLLSIRTGRRLFQRLPLIAGLSALGPPASEAKPRKKKKACPPCKKRKKGKCKGSLPDGTTCPGGTCEGGRCVTPPDPCASCSGDEVCSGGVCIVPACDAGGPCRVFVSSTLHNGNLGGFSGADATCQALADAAGLPGSYKAWLSDSTSSPISRFVPSSGPYRLVNGTTIAANFADLTDGVLAAPINVTETGGGVGDTRNTWTYTRITGGPVFTDEDHCANWSATTAANFGDVGDATESGAFWTEVGGIPCNGQLHLYCFQQR